MYFTNKCNIESSQKELANPLLGRDFLDGLKKRGSRYSAQGTLNWSWQRRRKPTNKPDGCREEEESLTKCNQQ